MNEQDILDQMKNLGVNVGTMLSASASNEAVLAGLMVHKDDIDPELLKQLDKSLQDSRTGRASMKKGLDDLDKLLKRNGNPNSK